MNKQHEEQIRKAWEKAQPEAEIEWCKCGQAKQHCICDVNLGKLPTLSINNQTVNTYNRKNGKS